VDLVSERIEISENLEEINEVYYQRGWTDGLPIIPPTEERVERMLAGTVRKSQDSIGTVPPGGGDATIEKIAINAVMAGCLPPYMPVIIAAVEAMIEKEFNLHWIQATTHPAAPLIIINGPIRNVLGIKSTHNVFGQGSRANAAIGRAIRLILINIGGALPGELDLATHGQPGKYSFCIAENEETSPWEPLHVERGFNKSANTVTVCGVEGPHNINDHSSDDGESVLTTFAGTMATQGNNNILYQKGEPLLVIGPEHATIIARSGFSKQDVKHFLYEKARIPKKMFSKKHQQDRFPDFSDDALIPVIPKEDGLMVVVAGGSGKHSVFCPSFGLYTSSVMKEIKP
jgi:hypothetical protein